ncbi:D-tyrosyl-tRNA(Tyr) deacylase [bacterium]|nr:D-tyrosyl-tRNA(Tyr) deacylase [bacterium]
MRALVQRVSSAQVEVDNQIIGQIGRGLLVLVAVHGQDDDKTVQWMANKLLSLRLFSDDAGKMNLSCQDIGGDILVVSQFTLYGDCRRGCRPSYSNSAPSAVAEPMYRNLVERLKLSGLKIQEGMFQAHMKVSLLNDGPVTVLVDSPMSNGNKSNNG